MIGLGLKEGGVPCHIISPQVTGATPRGCFHSLSLGTGEVLLHKANQHHPVELEDGNWERRTWTLGAAEPCVTVGLICSMPVYVW